MTHRSGYALLLVLIGLTSQGRAQQPAGTRKEFDVASVKPSRMGNAGGEGSGRESIEISPESITMRNLTLRGCIRWAYSVRDFQISGPGWLNAERYDITARTSSPASNDDMRLMLQTLLGERFKLELHRETKELSIYALIAGKGKSRLREATGDGPSSMRPSGGNLEFRSCSMVDLAERLSARPLKVDRPVVDKTGIQGTFDFTLKIAGNDADLKQMLEGMERGGESAATLLLEQLRLRLQSQKGPVEILAIDHADKVPVEN